VCQKKRKRGTSPGAVASLNMDADYDPRIPNDYSIYKDLLRTRRKMILEKEKRDAQHERGFESSDYGSEDEDEPSLAKRPFREFVPPILLCFRSLSKYYEQKDLHRQAPTKTQPKVQHLKITMRSRICRLLQDLQLRFPEPRLQDTMLRLKLPPCKSTDQ